MNNNSFGNEVSGREISALHLHGNTNIKLGNIDTENINLSVDTDKE